MRRLNFTLDNETVRLLDDLARKFYDGNKSQTVRAALESLAAHTGHQGWVITGYTPKEVEEKVHCHGCGEVYAEGDVLYRPVFERGNSPSALPEMPSENWLDCPDCAEKQFSL